MQGRLVAVAPLVPLEMVSLHLLVEARKQAQASELAATAERMLPQLLARAG